MTPEYLAELKRLCDEVNTSDRTYDCLVMNMFDEDCIVCRLYCAARTALPLLLEENERLATENRRLEVRQEGFEEVAARLLQIHMDIPQDLDTHLSILIEERDRALAKVHKANGEASRFWRRNQDLEKHVKDLETHVEHLRGLLRVQMNENESLRAEVDRLSCSCSEGCGGCIGC